MILLFQSGLTAERVIIFLTLAFSVIGNILQFFQKKQADVDKVQLELSSGYKSLVDVRDKELSTSRNETTELQTKVKELTSERDAIRTEYYALAGIAVKDLVNYSQLKREKEVLEEELMKALRSRIGEGPDAKQR